MSKSYCMGVDVKGVLTNWKKKDLAKLFIDEETGRYDSAEEARSQLMDMLSEGKLVVPMGECDNWDYRTGCKGHEHDS